MSETIRVDESLVQRLPTPLVKLIRRAQNAKTPLDRHQDAYYLWEASLKLLASVTVVEYSELDDHEPKLVAMLENLARPTIGHWWEFTRRLVPVLADAGDAGFVRIRELIQGRARDDLPRAAGLDAALIEHLQGKASARSTVRLAELFDHLVSYRNQEIGHGAAGQRPGRFYDRMTRSLLGGMSELLGELDVLAGRRLMYVGEVRRQSTGDWLVERYELVGESARRVESLALAEGQEAALPRPERVYIERAASGPQSGRPTLLCLSPLVHAHPENEQFFFLNARRGRRQAEYLCYHDGEQLRQDVGAEQRELLARILRMGVDAEEVETWAARSQAEEPDEDAFAAMSAERMIGEYELLSRLGQGGMGVVYRAWQPSLGRQVALKCMLRSGDPKAEARFAREIRALGQVEHPGIVKVFTSGSEADQWFFVMELVEGADLAKVCEQLAGRQATEVDDSTWQDALTSAYAQVRSQEKALGNSPHAAARVDKVRGASEATGEVGTTVAEKAPAGVRGPGYLAEVVEIVRRVAEAAHALHEAGVVHRDIKPGNIMITAEGKEPVLMDLGLAQLADEAEGRLTRTRQFVGTLRYASPEQVLAAGRIDRRSDVYSLGATLWELLTLRSLFGAGDETPTHELMLRIQTTDPERPRRYNAHVPRDLEAIVLKCLEKDRSRRYSTAADLATDLGRFLSGEPVGAQPPSLTYLSGKFVRRYRTPLAVATVVLGLLLGGTVAAFIGIDQQRRAALDANERLVKEAYLNHIAVAERELTLNQDVDLASQLLSTTPEQLRGWEWHYLMRLRDGARPPLKGHERGLWMAVFSPDGRRVATASIDGTVKVWDAASGRELSTFRGHDLLGISIPGVPHIPVTCLSFSPDGRKIASGSFLPNPINLRESRGVVKVWEVETRRELVSFEKQRGVVLSLAFSPDGRRIASSSINEDNTFVVWDAQSGEVVQPVRGHTSHIHRLRFSPDGRILASASTDGSVKLWDSDGFQELRTIAAHSAPVIDVAFAPDGMRFASASSDGTVGIWETATGVEVLRLHGHTGAAFGVAFSPDGKRLASGGNDKTVRLWDPATGENILTLRGHSDLVWSVAFSPDGQQLVSASFDKEARIWDASPAEELTGPGLFTIAGHKDRVNSVAFSPDGRYLASGSWDYTVRLWDGYSGAELRTMEGHKGAVFKVAFSPDGTRLASGSWDHKVKVWDTASGRELLTFSGHTAPLQGVAFSPDGKRIVSGGFDGFMIVWDAETGKVRATCDGFVFPFLAMAFSPDGRRIASGSTDRSVRVWDSETGKPQLILNGHEAAVQGVAFNSDGTRLASASWDHSVKVWDVSSERRLFTQTRELLTLKGHDDRVNGVAFAPDGKRIASASDDKTMRLWNAETGREVLPPRRHRGVVWSVAFSPDGKRIATGCWSSSGWVRTWNLE